MWPIAPTFFAEVYDDLALYTRQTAWLYTVPEKAKEARYKTRSVVMPFVRGGEYLLEYLFEIGPTKPAGMGGLVGLDEIDLVAWQSNHGVRLSSWEIKTIRRLSQEYASCAMESREPKMQPPYLPSRDGISEDQRKRISDAMSSWADKLNGGRKPA